MKSAARKARLRAAFSAVAAGRQEDGDSPNTLAAQAEHPPKPALFCFYCRMQ
jgi:hypothetical protein